MSIKAPINLAWEGVNYKVIVDMALIERIDDELNILSLARMNKPEDVKLTKIAKLIYILLDSAGADVDAESVYQNMAINTPDDESMFTVVGAILPKLLPNFNSGKKKAITRKRKPRKVKK